MITSTVENNLNLTHTNPTTCPDGSLPHTAGADGIRADDIVHDGCLILRGVLPAAAVAAAAHAARTALSASGHDGSGVRVFHPPELPPMLRDLLITGPLARALTTALGPLEFLSVKTVVKDRDHGFATPWHQDRPYWGGCDKWSLWLALGPVGIDDGCLRIVRGSQGALRDHQHHADAGIGFVNRMADGDLAGAEDLPMAAGDAVLFHDLLLHVSQPTAPGRGRVALIATYRGRGVADSSTVWGDALAVEG